LTDNTKINAMMNVKLLTN